MRARSIQRSLCLHALPRKARHPHPRLHSPARGWLAALDTTRNAARRHLPDPYLHSLAFSPTRRWSCESGVAETLGSSSGNQVEIICKSSLKCSEVASRAARRLFVACLVLAAESTRRKLEEGEALHCSRFALATWRDSAPSSRAIQVISSARGCEHGLALSSGVITNLHMSHKSAQAL